MGLFDFLRRDKAKQKDSSGEDKARMRDSASNGETGIKVPSREGLDQIDQAIENLVGAQKGAASNYSDKGGKPGKEMGVGVGIGFSNKEGGGLKFGFASPSSDKGRISSTIGGLEAEIEGLKSLKSQIRTYGGTLYDRGDDGKTSFQEFNAAQGFKPNIYDTAPQYGKFMKAGGDAEQFKQLKESLGKENAWRIGMDEYIQAKQAEKNGDKDAVGKMMDIAKYEIRIDNDRQKMQDKIDSGQYKYITPDRLGAADTPNNPKSLEEARQKAQETGAAMEFAQTGAKQEGSNLQDASEVNNGLQRGAIEKSVEGPVV